MPHTLSWKAVDTVDTEQNVLQATKAPKAMRASGDWSQLIARWQWESESKNVRLGSLSINPGLARANTAMRSDWSTQRRLRYTSCLLCTKFLYPSWGQGIALERGSEPDLVTPVRPEAWPSGYGGYLCSYTHATVISVVLNHSCQSKAQWW